MINSNHPMITKFFGNSKLDYLQERIFTKFMEIIHNCSLKEHYYHKDCTSAFPQIILIGVVRVMKYIYGGNIMNHDI